ncbi:MAG: T9SS type A sorting domain-containing protein [Bacteroidales bacterium]|nr:T9SS type A sorting domain-containing protein [Bacteroidales bacterium]
MKKFTIIITVLIAVAINANAQIPNSGFETWTNYGTYMEADGWSSTNMASAGTFYPVTRASDPYPVTIGNYSIRLENKPALLPSYEAIGFVWTLPATAPQPEPSFPITGHPTSLTGYYKWAPQNGDTMFVQIILYHEGTGVAYDDFSTTTAAASWTPFSIPISSYTDADSGLVIIAAFYSDGPYNIPYGNSVLYVDNLNFDGFVGVASEQTSQNDLINLYPNPASDKLTIESSQLTNESILTICNINGQEMIKEQGIRQKAQVDVSNLPSGIYFVKLITDKTVEVRKIIKE